MINDPIGKLTAADTLLVGSIWQRGSVPPELASVIPLTGFNPAQCVTKPAGQLLFVLNSVQNLGFPTALDFDVAFVGTVVQAPTPTDPRAFIRFDVNQIVQRTFALPGGLNVFVEAVTGTMTPFAQAHPPLAGKSCLGLPRVFDANFSWTDHDLPGPAPLTVFVLINGQPGALTLEMKALGAQSGEPELPQVRGLSYAKWWQIISEHLPVQGGPPPPPPWRQAMQDALLGLASAELAWETSARTDGRRLQQAALGVVEASLARLRSIIDEKG